MGTNAISRVIGQLRQATLRKDTAALTDGDLLQQYVARRDEAAFEALVRRHGPMVLGVCRRVLRNGADAEDAFQATFLVLVRKAASIRSRGTVSNWLYGVAHNTALKLRAMNRKRCVKEQVAGTLPKRETRGEDWQEMQAHLDAELSKLPAMHRLAVVLCDLEGKTIKEAARHLGWPQGTVATRLTRGRAELARRLRRLGLMLSGGVVAVAVSQVAASASVPASLVVSTVQAATAVAVGQAAASGVISTKVVALMEGVVKVMLIKKLKALTTMLLTGAVLGSVGGLMAYQYVRAEPQEAKQIVPSRVLSARSQEDQKEAQSKQAEAKSDKEAIQGTWVAMSGEQNGEKVPKEKLEAIKLIFTEDKVTREGYEPAEGTYKIDPEKNPKEIDLFTDAKKPWMGIYELKGTSLKLICKTKDRPTDYDSNGGRFLLILEKK